jgi:GNAT superfamily N-acetyltransferase
MNSPFLDVDLDRPIWTALATSQAHLGYGNALARRYHPEVAPFAAIKSQDEESYAALHKLLSPGDRVLVKSVESIRLIDGFDTNEIGQLHQMVFAGTNVEFPVKSDLVLLQRKDVGDIRNLVEKTKPGPFGDRTLEMGSYVGVRDNGRLVAMAGERMRFNGYVEVSAVCVDPDLRGKGLARRVVLGAVANIQQAGAVPFLHVLAENESAIGLYETLGFELRRTFVLSALSRAKNTT